MFTNNEILKVTLENDEIVYAIVRDNAIFMVTTEDRTKTCFDAIINYKSAEHYGWMMPFELIEDSKAIINGEEVNIYQSNNWGNYVKSTDSITDKRRFYFTGEFDSFECPKEINNKVWYQIENANGNPDLEKFIGITFWGDSISNGLLPITSIGYPSGMQDEFFSIKAGSIRVYPYNVKMLTQIKKNDTVRGIATCILASRLKDEARLIAAISTHEYHTLMAHELWKVVKTDEYTTKLTNTHSQLTVNTSWLDPVSDIYNGITYFSPECIKENDTVIVTEYYKNHKCTVLKSFNNFVIVETDNELSCFPYCSYLPIGRHDTYKYIIRTQDIRFYSRDEYSNYREDITDTNALNNDDVKEIKELFKKYIVSIPDISVGDKVRVRQKEEMINLYGKNDKDEPKIWRRFTTSMEHLCGATATVESIDTSGGIKLKDWDVNDNTNTDFLFCIEMFDIKHNTPCIGKEEIEGLLTNANFSLKEREFDLCSLQTSDIIVFKNGDWGQVILNPDGHKYVNIINPNPFDYRSLNSYNIKAVSFILRSGARDLIQALYYGRILYEDKPIIAINDIEIICGGKLNLVD